MMNQLIRASSPCEQVTGSEELTWPESDEVHLHVADLEGRDALVGESTPVFSADERAHSERFRYASDAQRFLAGRTFLRATLSRYVGTRADELRFGYSELGKPMLLGVGRTARLRFNLSHSGRWAVLGVAVSEIGVDIEVIRPVPEIEDIAHALFTAREADAVLGVTGAERLSRFYKCWTRKEAFLKAVGVGLHTALKSFEVAVAPTEAVRIVHIDNENANDWSLLAPAWADDLVIAVAVRQKDAWIGMRRWSQN